jgi:hypothetical protein
MGANDPKVRVGTSGTSPALGRNYADNAATAGHVFTAQGDNLPPIWAPGGGGGVAPINHTLVVDAVNFSATPTGTFAAPFQTLQAAINHAAALAWPGVMLLIAPGTYPDDISIPAGIDVIFHGWDEAASAVLSGDTITCNGDGAPIICFSNCTIYATTITSADPFADAISLRFFCCLNAANITGLNVLLEFYKTNHYGDITANNTLNIVWDGWSWAELVWAWPVPITPANYTRSFVDAGHDTYVFPLVANGLAVGATAFMTSTIGDGSLVRADDHAQIRVDDPTVQDYICGVHGCGAGTVTVWLTNLSRNPGNFAESAEIVIHHNEMMEETAP